MTLMFLAALLAASLNFSAAQAQEGLGGISGTVGGWEGGIGYAILANGATIEEDGSITLFGPVYTGEVGEDGIFTILFDSPSGADLNWRDFCPEVDFDGALVGAVLISDSPNPTRAEQVSLYGSFGAYNEAAEALNPRVFWLYSANAREYRGNCGAATMSLELAAGWTNVISFEDSTGGRSFDTRAIPADAVWVFSPLR